MKPDHSHDIIAMKHSLLPLIGFLAVLLVAGTGCADDPSAPGPVLLSDLLRINIPHPVPSDGTFGTLSTTASIPRSDASPTFQSGGSIFDRPDHGNSVDGGIMTTAGVDIVRDVRIGYLSFEASAFGTVATWGLSGNVERGVPSWSGEMYVPDVVRIVSPTSEDSLSKSRPLRVTWNPDPNNDSVVFGMRYESLVSQVKDSTLPDLQIQWIVVTADDGEETIPSSAFEDLPVGGLVKVFVSRGSTAVAGPESHPFYLYAYTNSEYGLDIVE